jgi:hypothetical protein
MELDYYGDSDLGWYVGLVHVPDAFQAQSVASELGRCLNYQEMQYILSHEVAIVEQDERGFVSIGYFAREADARKVFDPARDAYESANPDNDNPDE